jgi:hypothetical protein
MQLRRRTKVILICVGVPVALVAAGAIWIAIASRDIPPPDFSDLAFPFQNIPAEANAHTWFQAAGSNVVWGERERSVYDRYRNGGTAEVAEVEAILATNAPALALLRRGLACTACQPPLVTNLATFGGINIGPVLGMAKLLSMDSRWKIRHNDTAGALADCLDLLRFGDLESRQATSLIQYLTAQMVCGMGCAAGTNLVTSGRLNDASLQTLDNALRNLDVGVVGLPNAMRGEFLFCSGVIKFFRWGDASEMFLPNMPPALMSRLQKHRAPPFLLKPNETRLFYAQGAREVIRNVPLSYREMTLRDFEHEFGLQPGSQWQVLLRGNAVGKILAAAIYPETKNTVEQRCRMECDRSGLRLLIACQRYERRNGLLPAKLDDLVPEFIEAVPKDPFDGQPLRYSAERRIIWSVGKNLKDDGGSKMDSNGGGETDNRRKMLDYVIDIPPRPKL